MREHIREYYPTDDPRRVLVEGLETASRGLGAACVSFTLEKSFCHLNNLSRLSMNNSEVPMLLLYNHLNGFYWQNRGELDELGVLDIFEDIEYGMITHGNLVLEDVFRINRSNMELYPSKELVISTLDM